jgi:hypothetical protein
MAIIRHYSQEEVFTNASTDNHLNDEQTILPNKIFDAIMRIENIPQPYPPP